MMAGMIIRLFYCIEYPVQPRDSYRYENIIIQLEETGTISDKIAFFPLSLWILKIPYHYWGYDIVKGGIVFNMLLGVTLICLIVKTASNYIKDSKILFAIGLTAATNPMLIRFSCTLLRENTYLLLTFFSILVLISYYKTKKIVHLIIAQMLAAFSTLCRLEGFELIIISYMVVFLAFDQTRTGIKKTVIHTTASLVILFAFSMLIEHSFFGKNIKIRDAFSKIDIDLLE